MPEVQQVESIPVTCRSLNTDERGVEKGTYRNFQAIVQATQDGATRVLCPKYNGGGHGGTCKAKSGIMQDDQVDCVYDVGSLKK
jgi:hypothetical protein